MGTDEKKEEKKEEKEKDKKDSKKEDRKEKEKPKEPKKPKVETVKVDLSTDGSRNDVTLLDGTFFDSSKTKLEALAKADAERAAVELALNELQGYSVDLVDKLEEEEFQSSSTDEEREKLASECSQVSDWLDEEAGVLTPVTEFQAKLKVLKELAAPVMARLREHRERPEALEMLRQSLNSSNNFLEKSRDLVIPVKGKEDEEATPEAASPDSEKEAEKTEESEKETKKEKKKTEKPDEGLFTAKELQSLEKKIADVEKWRDEKLEEQEKQPLSEMPKLTVSLIKSKIQDLDSEVQLLIGKARMIKAERDRAKRKAEEDKKKEEEKAKKEKKDKKKKKKDKENAESEKEDEAKPETEEPPVNEGDSTKSEDSTEKKPEPTANTEENASEESKEEAPSDEESEHTEL